MPGFNTQVMKSKTRMIAIGAGLLAIAIAVGVLYGITGRDVHARPPAVLDDFVLSEDRPPLPEVRFLDAEGGEVRLSSYLGRHVVLNLWATWCGPCVTELPALAALKAALDPEQVAVLAVDLEDKPVEELEAFLAEHGAAGLGVYRNPGLDLMRTLEIYGLPLTIVVDPQGRQIGSSFGDEPWDHPQVIAYFRRLAAPAEP